jgi:flagellar protein FliL
MADAAQVTPDADAPKPRGGGRGLLFGALGGLALGGVGFYAVYSGLADLSALGKHETEVEIAPELADISFVPIEPVVISLPPGSSARHLRFVGQLEVEPARAAEVQQLMPRIVDVLNTYLRAVEVADLERRSAMPRLRAQMLRRVQVVVGEGKVRDLLIVEFILT